ncbi:DUF4365 domain-containing protein [Nocardioides conyzicola]|uniref:DUF4365 domain-containing protein n=1 Tax=Nocardioides conyzicola TaxID=1651781 RepID=A0ABP8XF72_9ACTN
MADRPRGHELETESERALLNVLPTAWVIRDLTKGDYGIDCEVEVFENGATTGLTFKVQLKGTDSSKPTRSIPLAKFGYWHSLDVPVLIALWHSKSSSLRAVWSHAHDPGRLSPNQETTTVRFFPEHDLSRWWTDIPDQLRLLRSIRRGTITFPLPIRAVGAGPVVAARLHLALRQELRSRDLESVFLADAGDGPAITAELTASELRVSLPLNVRSLTIHGARGSVTRDSALASSAAVDVLAMAALLISPIGTGQHASKVLSSTAIDSNIFQVDTGEEALHQVVSTLRDSGESEALVRLVEFIATESHLAGTAAEAHIWMAATAGPLEAGLATRLADAMRQRSDDTRAGDPETSARYLFNAGQVLLHNHLWAEGVALLDALETFSDVYEGEPEFYRGRAQGHWWLNSLELALLDYQRAWDLGLRDAALVDALSDALMYAGRYEEALAIASTPSVDDAAARTILRRIVLRDLMAMTGVRQQDRLELDAAECDALTASDDAESIRGMLVERDALAPTLLIRLAELTSTSATGGAILLALWNEEVAMLWVLAIVQAVASAEQREVVEALARAGSHASSEFLDAFSEVAADASTDCQAHEWDAIEEWVYGAAASNPFRKGGLRPLGLHHANEGQSPDHPTERSDG